jgi:Secretion system C-terminal sorting domain
MRKLQIPVMKKILILFALLLLYANLKAQHPDKIIIFLLTDFETNYPDNGLGGWLTDSVNPWVIDETNPENIWQIGETYKAAFDTAYSTPNAIMTDTLNPYPVNNYSTFEYLITKPEWAKDRCISHLQLLFQNMYETDTLCDGGFVEISYNNSNTYNNIIFDNIPNTTFFQNFYESGDTIVGGIPAFNGKSLGNWEESGIIFLWNDDQAQKLDSIRVRFNFKSDNEDNNKAGWIIDNIRFLIEDYCDIGINDPENESEAFIYPNPVTDISILEIPEKNSKNYIQIFDVQGKEVFNCISNNSIEINRSDFNTGIYFYKITNSENKTFTGKFIVK